MLQMQQCILIVIPLLSVIVALNAVTFLPLSSFVLLLASILYLYYISTHDELDTTSYTYYFIQLLLKLHVNRNEKICICAVLCKITCTGAICFCVCV